MPEQRSVFISHSHADNTVCDQYVEALRALGLDVWYDRTNLEAGQRLTAEIERELQVRTVFVVMLSVTSVDSPWVQAETDAYRNLMSKDRSRLILPVRLDGCAVPLLLTGYKYVDALALGFDRALVEIARAIGALTPIALPKAIEDTEEASGQQTQSQPNNEHNEHEKLTPSAAKPDTETGDAPDDATAEPVDVTGWSAADERRWTHDRLDIFVDRLGEAFPGRRGLHVYTGRPAFECLVRLLRAPLALPEYNNNSPLWWWRGNGCLEIDEFRVLDERRLKCLVGAMEIVVDTVAVYRNTAREYQSFVYLLASPETPTGIHPLTQANIEQEVEECRYATEEVVWWEGRYISRAEYDDGFAEVDGTVVRVERAESRTRLLSPFNVFIASQTHVLNSPSLDNDTQVLMDQLLTGRATLDDLVNRVKNHQLPRRIAEYYYEYD